MSFLVCTIKLYYYSRSQVDNLEIKKQDFFKENLESVDPLWVPKAQTQRSYFVHLRLEELKNCEV